MTAFFTGFLAQGTGTGTVFSEFSGAGYARQPITMGALSGAVSVSTDGATFGPNTSSVTWAPNVTQHALVDASGNVLLWWALSTAQAVAAGATHTVKTGALQINLLPTVGSTSVGTYAQGFVIGSSAEGTPVITGTSVAINNGVIAAVPSPQKSPRQLNLLTGRTQLVSVANSTGAPGCQNTSAGLLNASGNPIAQQLTYVAPASQAINNLQIGIPGWAVTSLNEINQDLPILWKVAIEYPTGTTLQDVTWNGSLTVLATPSRNTYWSDNCAVYIPAGAVYTVRMYGVIQNMSPPVFGITVAGGAITAVGGIALSAMSFVGNTVFCTSSLAHGLPVGITFPVTIAGVTPAGYNGTYTATVISSTQFTFPLAGTSPGAVTTQGTYISYGQGLRTAPTLSLSALGAGSGGSVTPTFNFSVNPVVQLSGQGAGYTSSPITCTTSGGGGSVQPTWQVRVKNAAVVDMVQLTPGSSDFTSVPTPTFSGGGGTGGSVSLSLANGQMVGTPTFVAGSGYTNGIYVASFPSGGILLTPGVGNHEQGSGSYRSYVYAGSSAADYTSNAAATPGGQFSFWAFDPLIRAQLSGPSPCIGIVGTSIEFGYQDVQNFSGCLGYVVKSLSGDAIGGGTGGLTSGLPLINIARSTSTAIGLLGSGRGSLQALIDGGATHIICGHPRNDIANGLSATAALSLVQSLWGIWLNQGITVYATTLLPTTTSTDGWATTANQTALSYNAQLLAYNALLRANAATYGVQVIDIAGFFDSGGSANPTGLWAVTGSTGTGAGYLATISGGAIATVSMVTHGGGNPTNGGYLSGGSGTGTLQFWGGGGSGAAGTFAVSSGVGGAATITNAGSGYTTPPLVAAVGAMTTDGIHPSTYGYQLATATSGLFVPSRFSL